MIIWWLSHDILMTKAYYFIVGGWFNWHFYKYSAYLSAVFVGNRGVKNHTDRNQMSVNYCQTVTQNLTTIRWQQPNFRQTFGDILTPVFERIRDKTLRLTSPISINKRQMKPQSQICHSNLNPFACDIHNSIILINVYPECMQK